MLAACLILAGCGGLAHWQSEADKTKADYLHMRTEQQERANYAACVNQGALPGSAENLACQLEMTRKEQAAAKPPAPVQASPQTPDKSP